MHAFSSFDRRRARFELALGFIRTSLVAPPVDALTRDLVIDEVLPEIERIGHGIRVTARSGLLSASEARAIIRSAGITDAPVAGFPDAIRASEAAARERALGRLVIARLHPEELEASRIGDLVLGMIPRLPEPAVSWPYGRRSYGDMAGPVTIGDEIERIDEIERTIWSVAMTRRAPRSSAVRRTFAFFETGIYLATVA